MSPSPQKHKPVGGRPGRCGDPNSEAALLRPAEWPHSPFLVVGQRVVGRKSSVWPGLPPARERFLFGRATFSDLRFSRR